MLNILLAHKLTHKYLAFHHSIQPFDVTKTHCFNKGGKKSCLLGSLSLAQTNLIGHTW